MDFAEVDNGAGGRCVVSAHARSLRESRLCQRRNHREKAAISPRRDMTTNGRHRLGTPVIVVRLMGCAFLRLLSQPADYDMLVASASKRATERAWDTYPIPRVPGTVTPFARLMTAWHLALPRSSPVSPRVSTRATLDGSIRGESVAKQNFVALAFNSCELIVTLDSELANICVSERERADIIIILGYSNRNYGDINEIRTR